MIRIAHIITGLNTGGAETMLYKLLAHTDRSRFTPAVWCLTDEGPVAEKLRKLDIPVVCVGMRRGLPDLQSILRLSGELKRFQPDLVQTWLYHADIAGGIAARMAGVRRVVWNIRNSSFDPAHAKRTTVLMAKIAARLSSLVPDAILCCSDVARTEHIRLGYTSGKITVLSNGFDITALRPDGDARRSVRDELGVPPGTQLVGLVARFDPQKDHANFFQAAARIKEVSPHTAFVCCGDGVTKENPQIVASIAGLKIDSSLHLLGRRSDIARLNAALDVAVSASRYGEGFPNVIGEAMACGVPCVVTNSGDGPFVVADTGRIVPPADPSALAEAILTLLRLPDAERAALGSAARQRIVTHFEIGRIAECYADFYSTLLTTKRNPSPVRSGQEVQSGDA